MYYFKKLINKFGLCFQKNKNAIIVFNNKKNINIIKLILKIIHIIFIDPEISSFFLSFLLIILKYFNYFEKKIYKNDWIEWLKITFIKYKYLNTWNISLNIHKSTINSAQILFRGYKRFSQKQLTFPAANRILLSHFYWNKKKVYSRIVENTKENHTLQINITKERTWKKNFQTLRLRRGREKKITYIKEYSKNVEKYINIVFIDAHLSPFRWQDSEITAPLNLPLVFSSHQNDGHSSCPFFPAQVSFFLSLPPLTSLSRC